VLKFGDTLLVWLIRAEFGCNQGDALPEEKEKKGLKQKLS